MKKFIYGSLLRAAVFLLACAGLAFCCSGCNPDEAFDEDFMAAMAGWSVTGNVNNVCRFDEGIFDDPNCRFRE